MKKLMILFGVAALIVVTTSCGGGNTGAKFAPQERESKMSDSERADAIAKKRAELNSPMLDTLLYGHGVRLSIVEPKVQGDITPEISHNLAVKMLEMAAQNGISGLGNTPTFVMGAEITQTGRETTGTAPQKMVVSFDLNFKVLNTLNGAVYATSMQKVQGAGRSFEEAAAQAMSNVKNSSQIQQFLSTASGRIIDWYNSNLGEFKREVEGAAGNGNYALALALVESVPEQAAAAASWAAERQPGLFVELKHKIATENLAALQAAIATAGDEFDPAVGGHFLLIPTDSPEFAQAQALFDKYQAGVRARRSELEARAEREAAAQRAWDLEKAKMEHETELAQIEADKFVAKYQAQASAEAAKAQNRKGFWGGLGDRILGGIDAVSGFVGELFGD